MALKTQDPIKFAEEAINLFLEYRDVHGYSDEKEAKGKALVDISEFTNLCNASLKFDTSYE